MNNILMKCALFYESWVLLWHLGLQIILRVAPHLDYCITFIIDMMVTYRRMIRVSVYFVMAIFPSWLNFFFGSIIVLCRLCISFKCASILWKSDFIIDQKLFLVILLFVMMMSQSWYTKPNYDYIVG